MAKIQITVFSLASFCDPVNSWQFTLGYTVPLGGHTCAHTEVWTHIRTHTQNTHNACTCTHIPLCMLLCLVLLYVEICICYTVGLTMQLTESKGS